MDDRFAAVSTDPRFRRFPKKESKVKIDDRFAGMFKDAAFQGQGARDKRGRKVKSGGKGEKLRSYYRLAGDEEEPAGKGKPVASDPDSSSEDEAAEAEARWAKMRGLGSASSSSESEADSDVDEAAIEAGVEAAAQLDAETEEREEARARRLFGVGAMAANPQEQIPLVPDATPRLAVLDLDWEHVRAVDILAVLRSFCPPKGGVQRVTVYPSDYGLERMAEEATAGPQGIWDAGADGKQEDQGGSEEDEEGPSAGNDAEIERRRLRAYELSRLRYYYAVVECDGAATASRLYEECDGMEFLKTACKFDLRFVPEGQSFEGRKVRDTAEELPIDYAPPNFQTKALQHTNVDLTWDAVDSGRKQALGRRVTDEEIREDDYKDGPTRTKDWAKGGAEGPEAGGDQAVRDKDMELEVTFHPGLETLGERLLARKKAASGDAESVWDAYMRRRAEKRAQARRLGKSGVGSSDEDSDGDPDPASSGDEGEMLPAGVADDPFFQRDEGEDPFADPFFSSAPGVPGAGMAANAATARKKEKRSKRAEEGATAAERAELEMLLMDEADMLRKAQAGGTSSKPAPKLSKKERLRLKKAARRAERAQGSDDEELALAGKPVAGVEDPRFSSIVTSSLYALDPTDPRYKGESATLAKQVAKLRKEGAAVPTASEPVQREPAAPSMDAIVQSLKRKAKEGRQAGKKPKPARL
ncbi:Pre-rRNA-processing protein esf1 [Auxenochlorella protothecoides]|uniref:Pre-rRNA-processing protein esf1 n=1 Tax=Auxenochlorella protothecoides TaxID=3075 RepID=A0A087SA69_AUXPR|nr:Pre-rRNA-processing protein esf1 [Auxenochlorella protothecoides]KFM22623.1 Pre-rRNA-processing protein esf1 [Auxenochlorella protothecoides]